MAWGLRLKTYPKKEWDSDHNQIVEDIDDKKYLMLKDIDFKQGASSFTVSALCQLYGGQVAGRIRAQNHPLSEGSWINGTYSPPQAPATNFYNRTLDVINRYNSGLLYFDVTILPFYPVSDVGLKIATHFYSHKTAIHNGKLETIMFSKILNEEQRKALVWPGTSNQPARLSHQPTLEVGIGNSSAYR